jgi:segregation and condensation protein A
MSEYRVNLEIFAGPLDLLLYLIKREEVEIQDVPIARMTDQYLEYVGLIKQLDPNVAGEFLVMASTLLELKTRSLLPVPEADPDHPDELSDPRRELIQQLLEYKRFKDAAASLSASAELRRLRHARAPAADRLTANDLDLENLQIWDLVQAFHKLLAQTGRGGVVHEVVYDDTPISLHTSDLLDRLEREDGRILFQSVFEARSRGQMVGLFLALLELVRQKLVRFEQDETFGKIILYARPPEEAEALRKAEEEQYQEYQSRLQEEAESEELSEAPSADEVSEEGDSDSEELSDVEQFSLEGRDES